VVTKNSTQTSTETRKKRRNHPAKKRRSHEKKKFPKRDPDLDQIKLPLFLKRRGN